MFLTIFSTIAFFNKAEVVEIGKIKIIKEKVDRSKWASPITGIAIMGIGGILFWQTYNEQ